MLRRKSTVLQLEEDDFHKGFDKMRTELAATGVKRSKPKPRLDLMRRHASSKKQLNS
ncbi:MAG: hypothetical protein SGCHY_002256 [Lobulomycetales sp.]